MSPRYRTLVDVLLEREARDSTQSGFVFLDTDMSTSEDMSYGELGHRARRLAGRLAADSPAGERALLLFPPGLEYVAAFLGCLAAGAVAVPAYPPNPSRLLHTLPRLRTIARDANARYVLTTSAILSMAPIFFGAAPELEQLTWIATDQLPRDACDGWRPPDLKADDLAFLQYTSGSTGAPKGVMLTHGNLVANLEVIHRAFGIGPNSYGVCWLPPYHDMGLIGGILAPLYAGRPTVLMSPITFLRRPLAWLEAITRYKATISGGPNFAYDLCTRRVRPADIEPLDLDSWELAFCGAEPIDRRTLERFADVFSDCGFRLRNLFPCYGLAEATLLVSGARSGDQISARHLDPTALAQHRAVPTPTDAPGALSYVACGHSLGDQDLRIVDPHSRIPRQGAEVGEIWVASASIGAGYWGQSHESQETFGARLAGEPDAGPFLRTGDLGFILDDQLYITGRIKDLIIVRGRNHYPQDIEMTVAGCHQAIRPNGVVAFAVSEQDGAVVVLAEVERRLMNRQASVPFEPHAAAELVRRSVGATHDIRLSDVVFLKPGALPKTTSGKLQRFEARAMFTGEKLAPIHHATFGADPTSMVAAPPSREEIEEEALSSRPGQRMQWFVTRLREHVAGVLGTDPLTLNTRAPITSLGLDSMAAVELAHELERSLHVRVDPTGFLRSDTIEDLAKALHDQLLGIAPAELAEATALPDDLEHPASHGQAALWVLHRMSPVADPFKLHVALKSDRSVDVTRVRRSLQAVLDRHPSLRTEFVSRDGEVAAIPRRNLPLPFEEVDASSWTDEEVDAYLASSAERPFELRDGALIRLHVARARSTVYFVIVCHHLGLDYWSFVLLLDDVRSAYVGAANGKMPKLPAPPRPFSDFVMWQRSWLESDGGQTAKSHFLSTFGGSLPPAVKLPLAREPRPAVNPRGGAVIVSLPAELSERVRSFAKQDQLTPFIVLLAAFELLLHRYSGQERVAVGVPFVGRTAPFDETVGYFMNPLPIGAVFGADVSFRTLAAEVRATVLAALRHQFFPATLVHASLRGGSDERLFNTIFTFNRSHGGADAAIAALAAGQAGVEVRLGDAVFESVALGHTDAPFPLAVMIGDTGSGFVAGFQYSCEVFERSTVERMASHYQAILWSALRAPDEPVRKLSYLGPDEENALRVLATGQPAPTVEVPVHVAIDEIAKVTPDAIAVQAEHQVVTYTQLREHSDALALALAQRGVTEGDRVGVLARRNPDWIVALLGILKSGAVYVPLNPYDPNERLQQVMHDAALRAVIASGTDLQLAALSGADVLDARAVRADRSSALAAQGAGGRSVERPPAAPSLERPAYMIYTSGSMGLPRGVVVSHRSIATYSASAAAYYELRATDRCLQFAAPSFDASLEEILPTLVVGATVVLRTDALSDSVTTLLSAARSWGITVLNFPTAYWHDLAAELCPEVSVPPAVRLVIIGGERALPDRVAQWRRFVPPVTRLVNSYGPTEATIVATVADIGSGEDATGAFEVPIGRPVAGARAYVLDDEQKLVSVGIPGELYIGGPGVALGYWQRPELTAQRFLPDPLGVPDARVYRTGDRVRWRSDGQLEYLGRLDDQVKIRGFRVEPGEVEWVLRQHAGVADVAVVPHEAEPGDRRLVAYVVPSGDLLEVTDLRSYAREHLPSFMVPWAFMQLDRLPRTAVGKLHRQALPPPIPARLASSSRMVLPRNAIEESISRVWCEVLGLSQVGIHDDFFELGGHSLLATKIAARLRAIGIATPLAAIFRHPTIASLGQQLSKQRADERSFAQWPPIEHAARDQKIPLSFAQQRIWFLARLDPRAVDYNVPRAIRIRGPLQVDLLRRSYGELAARHEILRTSFPADDGGPYQAIRDAAPLSIPVLDIEGPTAEAREALLHRAILEQSRAPFDIENGPLIRATLLKLGPDDHVLVQVEHHLIHDGWTQGVLIGDLLSFYRSFATGTSVERTPLPVQYADFAAWQRKAITPEIMSRQLGYWHEKLSGAPPLLDLPTDRPRPAVVDDAGDEVRAVFSADLADGLRALAKDCQSTLFMVMLAGFYALLHRIAGQTDLSVGSGIANRRHPQLEGLLGMFINTVVLRVEVQPQATFRELVARVRETCLGAYENQDVPFERVVDTLRPRRSLSHLPLFQVFFAFQDTPAPVIEAPGLTLSSLEIHNQSAKFDLAIIAIPRAEQRMGTDRQDTREIQVQLEYRTALFDRATAQQLMMHFQLLLRDAIARHDVPVEKLELLPEEMRRTVTRDWSRGSSLDHRDHQCVHQLFEAAVDRMPDAPALSFGDATLTYRELDEAANGLAWDLIGAGLQARSGVGLCLERGPELVIAILAVLKAGAYYVPVEPSFPRARIDKIFGGARPAMVLTTAAYRHLIARDLLIVDLDDVGDARSERPGRRVEPRSLAYVLYTSGSTGEPKGVAVEHRSVSALMHWGKEIFEDELECCAFAASICFDVSVFELFLPLSWGGRVVVVRDAFDLPQVVEKYPIRMACASPSSTSELWRSGTLPAVPCFVLAGEALDDELKNGLFALSGVKRVVNAYGPTEATVYATFAELSPVEPVSIGRPLPHALAFVLDGSFQPVPVGVPGELCLGGIGLARGYYGRPDLTAERFCKSPFDDSPGARLYRTGDIVKWGRSGQLIYLGRRDQQVKLRGLRIELHEVEMAMRSHPDVSDAASTVRPDPQGHARLLGYVVLKHGAATTDESIRRHVEHLLPPYMVPSLVTVVPRLPLSHAGKIDRSALPEPSMPTSGVQYVGPRNAVEQLVARIVGDALGLPRPSINESFFELGGHSLMALQIVAKLRQLLGIELLVRSLFEEPTIAGLARVIHEQEGDGILEIASVVLEVEGLDDEEVQARLDEGEERAS